MSEQQVRGGRPPARATPSAVTAMRSELAKLRQSLDRLEAQLSKIDNTGPETGTAKSRPERYFQLLIDVYEQGRGGVDSDVFAQLGRSRSYDARGLGGFFVGNRAPLRRDDNRIRLTPEGHRLLDGYLSGDGA